MRSHDLAAILLESDDIEVTASVDMSTCDADSDKRIFGTDLYDYVKDDYAMHLLLGCYTKNYTEK